MIEAVIKKGKVLLGFTRSLESRGFGKRKGNFLELEPVEAFYLLSKNKIELIYKNRKLKKEEALRLFSNKNPNFPVIYKVYEDLRERGYQVKPRGKILVGKKVFFPVFEHDQVDLLKMIDYAKTFGNLVLSIVDDEFEITYYQMKEFNEKVEHVEDIDTFSGIFAGLMTLTERIEVFDNFFYGKKKNNLLELSLFETVYLVETGKLKIDLDLGKLIKLAKSLVSNFEQKYKVYKDLKWRGFTVKTGLKFGSDFRVYDKINEVNKFRHSKYLVSVTKVSKKKINEITRAVRLAQSVGKTMVFVILKDNNLLYLQIERVKP